MPIFSVHHVTHYRYRRPVQLGEHQILFRPRDSFDQRLLGSELTIEPEPARVRWIHDVFGNCATLALFEIATDHLIFKSHIRLDHTPENEPDFQIEEYAKEHPFDYHSEERPDLQSYTHVHHPDSTESLSTWLRSFLGPQSRMPTGRLLMTLNEAIAESFAYLRRTTRGTQTPAETLATKRGTCRDFALLMMEAARYLGFAARFVTGYIYVPDRDGPQLLGGGATHAWCQIYLPGSGWVEFDPTNAIVGNRDLIRVAVTRTPEQAVPLSGSFYGDRADELGMEVSVNVKRVD